MGKPSGLCSAVRRFEAAVGGGAAMRRGLADRGWLPILYSLKVALALFYPAPCPARASAVRETPFFWHLEFFRDDVNVFFIHAS